jgi:hypothetical protein
MGDLSRAPHLCHHSNRLRHQKQGGKAQHTVLQTETTPSSDQDFDLDTPYLQIMATSRYQPIRQPPPKLQQDQWTDHVMKSSDVFENEYAVTMIICFEDM